MTKFDGNMNDYIQRKFGVSPTTAAEARRMSTQNRVDTYNATVGKDDGTGVRCSLCNNRGVIAVVDDESGNFTITECKCYGRRLTAQRLKKAGLWQKALDCRLDNFQTNTETQKTMKEKTVAYIADPGSYWLAFLGQSGSGKSHLCTAAFVQLISKRGLEGQYLQWNQDSRKLKSVSNDDTDDLWGMYKKTQLLYIDDVFKGSADPTGADIKLLFEVLDYRSNNKLLTILSSEMTINRLLQVDEAIGGRIKEKCGSFLVNIEPDRSKNFRLQ